MNRIRPPSARLIMPPPNDHMPIQTSKDLINMRTRARLELEHISCDLCGSPEYTVRYRKPDSWLWLSQFEYPVVECANCSLVYVNPRPTFKDAAFFYPTGYHDNRNDPAHRERYRLQFSYIEKWSGTRILDIGCARGDWLNFIKDKWPDAELHGADAFSRGVNNDGIRFYGGHLPDAPLPLSYFDLVTAWAVFEHLHTPKAYFETVAKALRPGGKFVFLVTNSESCYGRYAYKEDVPRHLYHFSERTLSLYASKCGFSLKEVYFDDRLWDGRGLDTFKFSLGRLAGVTWSNFYQRRFNFFQKVVLNAGILLDRLVFSGHWEANRRRSGIIIVVMEKTQPHNSTQQ